MKKILFLLTVLHFLTLVSFAQENPVQWNIISNRIDSNKYEVIASATLPQGWHLYYKDSVASLDPAIFSFDYENIRKEGEIIYSGTSVVINDPVFATKLKVYTGAVQLKQVIIFTGPVLPSVGGNLQYFLGKGEEFLQKDTSFVVQFIGASVKTSNDIHLSTIDLAHPLAPCGDAGIAHESLWMIFFLGFIGGLIGLLTPCVFPMIPVTVSFFTKRSGSRAKGLRNAVMYGFFIFFIYILASLPFHLFGVQPEILNNISTNAPLNVFFFAIFILFAISFFGYFEITLPGGLANKTDAKANITSMGGIFFMALTLVIVSFSCTGVILGSLLVGSLNQGPWPVTIGFAGFGAALALPFALFAIFPHWLSKLPRSGGWLDTVKKILAFLELGLALKFLSNADLVMHWGILKREVFVALWILISIGLALYLFGVLHLPHDDRTQKPGLIRKLIGCFAILFILYMVPGLTNTKYANLKWLSGMLPPLSYSLYGEDNLDQKGLHPNVLNNYAAALDSAKKQHKPVLIDFTGWACVNCRRMEENVWTQQEVHDYIKTNFILVSLYVDDRENLPVEQRISGYKTKDGATKNIKTIGDKWATFQAENFNQVTQPLYVVLDTKERLVTYPVGYTPDWKEYLAWLKCGKETFDKNK
jgi:cytochrome c biogenesis protein CcdA/thioredoxin-related protein